MTWKRSLLWLCAGARTERPWLKFMVDLKMIFCHRECSVLARRFLSFQSERCMKGTSISNHSPLVDMCCSEDSTFSTLEDLKACRLLAWNLIVVNFHFVFSNLNSKLVSIWHFSLAQQVDRALSHVDMNPNTNQLNSFYSFYALPNLCCDNKPACDDSEATA